MSPEWFFNTIIGIFSGVMIWIGNDIRSRLGRLESKMETKVDSCDHDKLSSDLLSRMTETWKRFDDRVSKQELNLIDHRHEKESGNVILRGRRVDD